MPLWPDNTDPPLVLGTLSCVTSTQWGWITTNVMEYEKNQSDSIFILQIYCQPGDKQMWGNRKTSFLLKPVSNWKIISNLIQISDKDDRGRSLRGPSKVIAIENVDCSKSICTADVVLIRSLSEGQTYK